MRITFSCPTCEKPYDLPLSLAGKRARCKKCSTDFVIPAPADSRPPGSSEAIPVAIVLEPPKAAPSVPTSTPPPVPARSEQGSTQVEEEGGSDDEPWPEYTLAPPLIPPKPVASPPRTAADPPSGPSKASASGRKSPAEGKAPATADLPPRPRWFVPAVIVGSFAVVFAVNFGAFLAFSRPVATPQVEVAQAEPPNLAEVAEKPAPPTRPTTARPPRPSVAKAEKPASPATPRPEAVASVAPADVAPDRPMNSEEIVARNEASVALIKGKKGTGTGFVVRPGILATNAHVIDGERSRDLEVRFPSAVQGKQGPFSAKVLFQDRDRDLALLSVACDLPPVKIADGYKFRKGEDVTVIGNPGVGGQLILENAISRGLVSSMTKLNQQMFIQLSIAINPGNSGGPVFDTQGRVIGVVTLKTTKQEGLAFAIPVEDLVSAIGTAETLAGVDPKNGSNKPAEPDVAQPRVEAAEPRPGTAPPKGNAEVMKGEAPRLAYAWKPGEVYVYSFEESLDVGANLFALKGCSIYKVKAVDGEGITLAHRGWYVQSKRSKEGYALPGGISPPTTTPEIEIRIDPQGEVLKASGSSPLPLLGDFAMLIIEPLPDEPQKAWNDSKTITLNEVEQAPGAGGGIPRIGRPGANNAQGGSLRSRIQQRRGGGRIGRMANPIVEPQAPGANVTAHEATEETTYVLGEREGSSIPIRKLYQMTTKDLVGDEPRFSLTGQGTLSFDVQAGIPLGLEYKLKVVENTSNATFRLPITVRCKLLEGREKKEGLQPPVYTPTAMNKIESDQVTKLVTEVGSSDGNRRREASKTLRDSAPIEANRAEVSRALERLSQDQDSGIRSEAIKALGIWGDQKAREFLVGLLSDANFGARDDLFESLARLSPTEATAEAIIACLYKDRGRAQNALQAIGEASEGPLLNYAERGTDKTLRILALQYLKDHGTTQSLPMLQKFATWKQAGQVGGMAADVAKQIRTRHPSDDELAALIKQLRSSDAGKRREAAGRFGAIPRSEKIQADVARGLERVASDTDDWAQSNAFKALALWGDDQSRKRIIEILEDPDLHTYREAIETLGKLGPDETSVRAIGRWIKKDRRLALPALVSMGEAAEEIAIAALKDATKENKDVILSRELCQFLGKVGTDKSLTVLKEFTSGWVSRSSQEAIQQIEERLKGSQGASLIAELKKNDGGRRRQALERLAEMKPTEANRGQVARALEPLWESGDVPLEQLRNATIRWGDARTAEFLEAHLDDADFNRQEDALRVLVGLRPNARTAELVVARFKKNGSFIYELGQKIPTLMERPLLEMVTRDPEIRWKLEACKALGFFGTPAVLPELEKLGQKAGDQEIAANAEEAIRAINSRW